MIRRKPEVSRSQVVNPSQDSEVNHSQDSEVNRSQDSAVNPSRDSADRAVCQDSAAACHSEARPDSAECQVREVRRSRCRTR